MFKCKTTTKTNVRLGCKTQCTCRCHDNVKITQQNLGGKGIRKLKYRVCSVLASSLMADESSDRFINI